jgi:aspartate/methionine/tyrosine aminotransferase
VDFGLRHNIIIVNDNPYSFILNDNPMSLLSVPRAKECCFELNSTSKSLNMPGWRIGMLAGNPELISYVLKAKSNVDSGMFKPMQMAAAKALEAGQDWYDSINSVYRARRKYAEAILDYIGCTYDKSQVGLFMWGKIPATYKSCEEVADKILYDCRVFVTPGFIFGSNGDRYIRISLCSTEEKLSEALQRIKENLK